MLICYAATPLHAYANIFFHAYDALTYDSFFMPSPAFERHALRYISLRFFDMFIMLPPPILLITPPPPMPLYGFYDIFHTILLMLIRLIFVILPPAIIAYAAAALLCFSRHADVSHCRHCQVFFHAPFAAPALR